SGHMVCQLMDTLIAVSWRQWASPKEKTNNQRAGGIGASRPPAFYCAEVTTISLSCSWIEPTLLSNLCSRSIAATASLNRKPAYGITVGSIGICPIAPLFGEAVTFPPAIWTASPPGARQEELR